MINVYWAFYQPKNEWKRTRKKAIEEEGEEKIASNFSGNFYKMDFECRKFIKTIIKHKRVKCLSSRYLDHISTEYREERTKNHFFWT